jgi:3-oxoacyl-[acyl-carrier protein] reductase
VALVTGGKRGLGRAYAEELARRGCRVIVTSRRPDEPDVQACLASLQARAPAGSAAPLAVAWDMDDPAGDAAVAASLRAAGIDVEILVHAAHVFPPHKLILSTSPDELAQSLRRNVVAPFALCRRLCRPMSRARFGRILFVGSLTASIGGIGQSIYITEKAALAGLVRAFSAELGARDVLVNLVEPGIVDTENVREGVSVQARDAFARRTLMKRLATPEEVVLASIGLLDPDQGFVTGQTLRIAGGSDGGGAFGGDDPHG